jgi:hypothetical protein
MKSRVELLQEYLTEVATKPVSAGEFDCAIFAADWVRKVLGEDWAVKWRGEYDSYATGRKLLAKDGYASHDALLESKLEEIPPAMGQLGDIGVIAEKALVIVTGDHVVGLGEEAGIVFVSRMTMERCFRL